jgi:hypothetical protein
VLAGEVTQNSSAAPARSRWRRDRRRAGGRGDDRSGMKRKHQDARDAVLRKLEALLHWYRLKRARAAHEFGAAARARRQQRRVVRQFRIAFKRRLPLLRKLAIGLGAIAIFVTAAAGALWWRLSSGPIALDVATPWLTAAIEQNFGNRHRVEVGGTVLERDSKGRTALRLRDIVVRNPEGEIVAVAPRAEIGVSGTSLLLGKPRVASFLLVGANLEIRVNPDGHVDIFAGGKRPFMAISPVSLAPPDAASAPPVAQSVQSGAPSLTALMERGIEKNIASVLAWVDGVGAFGRDGTTVDVTGFDGLDLTEVGIKNGTLHVDDARNGRQWSFTEVTLSLTRPEQGGIAFAASSESEARSWSLSAALLPSRGGNRSLRLEAKEVMLDHLLLLLQVGDGQFHSTLPISAELRAEIAPNGIPQVLRGRIVASGYLGDPRNIDEQIHIESVDFRLDWDAARGTLLAPIQLVSGSNRITLYTQLTPPQQRDGVMLFSLHGGSVVLGPLPPDRDPLVLKRIAVRIRHDLAKQRIELEQADLGTDDGKNVGLAITGKLDYSRPDAQLSLGLAGAQMSVSSLKRLWPSFVAPRVRAWVMQHLFSGAVDSIDIAINTPLSTLPANGPPMADNALAIDVSIAGATLRPVDGLPLVKDADITVRVTGRTATVKLGRGNAEISPGRRLVASNVLFELPDMSAPANVRFRLDGPVAAAAELLAYEKLRDISGTMFNPATSRGMMSAQIVLNMPLLRDLPKDSVNYNMNIDLTNFSAERMMMGQKVEAQLLRIAASNQAYQIKGDVKINGTPAQLEYRRARGETEAEVRLQATLDEAARMRLGIDLGGAVSGSIPIKLGGRIPANERDAKLAVEADLTAARIDNLLPGWIKPPGRPVRATFILLKRDQSTRFEDIYVDGSGAMLRGSIEVDSANELVSANLPVFALADGDKATLKAERGSDGVLRVTMRGDIFDGRSFVRSSISGASSAPLSEQKPKPHRDLDLDVKVSRVLGHHGEALRSVELRFTRRGGQVRAFALNATLGRDTPLKGDLRESRDLREPRGRNFASQVIYLDTRDAGALLRFTDVYPRMNGGRLWILMDPPRSDGGPQEGVLNIRDFSIRGERELAGVLPNAPNVSRDDIVFTSMNVEFTRTAGRLAIRDGVVRGPIIGATIDGALDYQRDEMRLRGTFVPLYTLNNMFTQIPIVGLLFSGGDTNTGVFGLTYEVVGTPSQPTLRINPASALAPGILRKFFEFPASNDAGRPAQQDPAR